MKRIKALAKEYIISVQGKENPDMQHEIENFLCWLVNNDFTIQKHEHSILL